jgi:hypothetical protein
MAFVLPRYRHPDFSRAPLIDAPSVVFRPVVQAGVAPENYHATTIYPEYFQVRKGDWSLLGDSRMDCVVVQDPSVSCGVIVAFVQAQVLRISGLADRGGLFPFDRRRPAIANEHRQDRCTGSPTPTKSCWIQSTAALSTSDA